MQNPEGQKESTSFHYKFFVECPKTTVDDFACAVCCHGMNRWPCYFAHRRGFLDTMHGYGHTCSLCYRRQDAAWLDGLNLSVIEQLHAFERFLKANFSSMKPWRVYFLMNHLFYLRQDELEAKWRRVGAFNSRTDVNTEGANAAPEENDSSDSEEGTEESKRSSVDDADVNGLEVTTPAAQPAQTDGDAAKQEVVENLLQARGKILITVQDCGKCLYRSVGHHFKNDLHLLKLDVPVGTDFGSLDFMNGDDKITHAVLHALRRKGARAVMDAFYGKGEFSRNKERSHLSDDEKKDVINLLDEEYYVGEGSTGNESCSGRDVRALLQWQTKFEQVGGDDTTLWGDTLMLYGFSLLFSTQIGVMQVHFPQGGGMPWMLDGEGADVSLYGRAFNGQPKLTLLCYVSTKLVVRQDGIVVTVSSPLDGEAVSSRGTHWNLTAPHALTAGVVNDDSLGEMDLDNDDDEVEAKHDEEGRRASIAKRVRFDDTVEANKRPKKT
jgi:hypothetical protein